MHSLDSFNIKMYSKNKADEAKKPNVRLEPLYKFNTTKLESLIEPVFLQFFHRDSNFLLSSQRINHPMKH